MAYAFGQLKRMPWLLMGPVTNFWQDQDRAELGFKIGPIKYLSLLPNQPWPGLSLPHSCMFTKWWGFS